MADKQPELAGMKSKGKKVSAVECLGQTFPDEAARREHFTRLLREKLRDPEFRRLPGFPQGTDEDILRMSDPPYYTACPNPFLAQFVEVHGTPYDPGAPYHREPFSVDTSVGKTDALYKAHGYHTKVPHLAIVPSILHYTEPGDVVLDGFCGSGMTGVAAQFCGTADSDYRADVEAQWKRDGRGKPRWGTRRAVLNDLGPAATFIAANYNLPFELEPFSVHAQRILDELEAEVGWMYQTTHSDGRTKCRINYTVWSEIFSCPECAGDVVFSEEALDEETKRVAESFPCPHCRTELTRSRLERLYEARLDPVIGEMIRVPKRRAVIINYSVGGSTFEKSPDAADLAVIERVAGLQIPPEVPHQKLPYMHMTHERARMDAVGVTHVHHFFLPRATHALSALWRKAGSVTDQRTRNMLVFFVEQAIWGMSLLNRYKTIMHGKTTSSNVNQYLSGVYYVPSQHSEVSPWYNLENRLGRYRRLVFGKPRTSDGYAAVTTGDCAHLALPASSVDYVFTDPPFGENIYYADLNFLVEAWHRNVTNAENEAIVDRAKKKRLDGYQALMRACFDEYARVLKPGRWMTVVFSNSKNAVWRAIQEALGTAGFVVADVRTLDKQQGSYRQVTSTAVKQDLVISAYKPSAALAKQFELGTAPPDSVWAFIREHLSNVPVFADRDGDLEVVVERTAQTLHDRMIAFYVQRGVGVPISGPEFFDGLDQRFGKRDSMYFLTDQAAAYDKKRALGAKVKQLDLFVHDEDSSIRWLRAQLDAKPQSFQDLQPQFMPHVSHWAKHERTVELRELLEQNFLHYDGVGEVPAPIHSYLSSNLKLRNRDKSDPELRAEGKDRWYVPSAHRHADMVAMRTKALLREFQEYKAAPKKLKQFRTEAVRAGFKAAYDARDYRTILDVAAKLPEQVVQEDEKLLMYLDVATTRLDTADAGTLFPGAT